MQLTKRLLLLLLAAIALPTAVNANVDPKVHKLCLPAADYLGCVKAMTGDSNSIEVITNPGTPTTKNNSCPFGYAYIGNGYCRKVVCRHKGGQNAPVIAGKQCESVHMDEPYIEPIKKDRIVGR